MSALYLVLCIWLAVALNAWNRWMRVAGTLTAAAALFMISVSIVLANIDGTFASFRAHGILSRSKPIVLDMQAGLGLVGTLFLLWAGWAQIGRTGLPSLPIRNTKSGFGLVSRIAHWTTATLMLLLIPIGLFVSVLPASADRASFLAAHQALGLTVLVVVIGRIGWLLASPPPPHDDLPPLQRRLALAAHLGLYGLIIAFPVTGFMMSAAGNDEVAFYGIALPHLGLRDGSSTAWRTLHDVVLPLAFYAIIFVHIGAVLKHHFADRRHGDVRRMLR